MMRLPDYRPKKPRVFFASKDTDITVNPGRALPKISKHRHGLVVDGFVSHTGHRFVKVFNNQDHENIKKLPQHAPRVVRALYRREFQLRLLRLTDWLSVADEIRDAELAFEKWNMVNGN